MFGWKKMTAGHMLWPYIVRVKTNVRENKCSYTSYSQEFISSPAEFLQTLNTHQYTCAQRKNNDVQKEGSPGLPSCCGCLEPRVCCYHEYITDFFNDVDTVLLPTSNV